MIMSILRPATELILEDALCTLLLADHIEFDAARKVQDITVDRSPLAIVRAADAADVAAGVAFERNDDHARPVLPALDPPGLVLGVPKV